MMEAGQAILVDAAFRDVKDVVGKLAKTSLNVATHGATAVLEGALEVYTSHKHVFDKMVVSSNPAVCKHIKKLDSHAKAVNVLDNGKIMESIASIIAGVSKLQEQLSCAPAR